MILIRFFHNWHLKSEFDKKNVITSCKYNVESDKRNQQFYKNALYLFNH